MKQCPGYGKKLGKCKNNCVDIKISPYCKNCAGKSFEDEVAELFAIQGYSIKQNLKLSSTQNDFFAQLRIGVISIGVLVECKYKFNEDQTVDGQDVRKFFGSWGIFNEQALYGFAEKAMLITNGQFAPEAFETAANLKIELLTLGDLLRDLVDFKPYLRNLVDSYKQSELNDHFIDLPTKNGDVLHTIVKEYIKDSDSNAIVILGDYGSGKTSFCTRLSFEMAQSRLKGDYSSRIPILIQLRDYNKAFNLEQVITDFLVNKQGILNGNFKTFLELLERGYFLLIFDGFDEASQKVDYGIKYKIFSEICRFAKGDSKIIVTCRTNYFNHRNEFEKIFKSAPIHFEPMDISVDFQEVEIGELSKTHTLEYIKSYRNFLSSINFSVGNMLTVLNDTHDLSDLARRPVLLNMMIQTIPKMSLDNAGRINSCRLYQEYTNSWLDREDSKGKTLIRSQEKIKFIRELSWKMFVTNKLSIHFSKMPQEILDYFRLNSFKREVDYFSHDIQSCSFLNRDDNGNYKFIHKSFMEYFVSCKLFDELSLLADKHNSAYEDDKDIIVKINVLLQQSLINLEIGSFVKDHLDSTPNNIKALSTINIKELDSTAQKNLLSILCKTDIDIRLIIDKDINLKGADLSYLKLKNGKFNGNNLLGVSFVCAEINNTDFKSCCLVDVLFRKSVIENSNFYATNFETSYFLNNTFKDCSFVDASFADSKLKDCKFIRCDFNGADFSDFKLSNTEFIECINMENTIGTPYWL